MSGSFTYYLKEVLDLEADTGNGFRIGLSDYPIFDEAYRDGLNRKIVQHFWNREIGLETVSLFEFNLSRKMWEIMPLYNQVYESTRIQFDPLATFNLTTIRTDTGHEATTANSASTAASTTTSASRTVSSDTPQTELSGDEDYATNASDVNSQAVSNNSGNGQNSSASDRNMNGTSQTKGFQGSAADLLLKYRATLLNVDLMVIGELNELFMRVWDNGEEHLAPAYGQLGGYYL